jgi:energy-coupling factor transport system permease protein
MTSATGYYRAGTSWLHRRSPITKLLALGLVLLATFLLPPVSLPLLLAIVALTGRSAGELRPMLGSLRIPALLFASIIVVNALFFPGAREVIVQLGPAAMTGEGVEFGVVSAGRLLVVFLASVLFLFTTLADDILEALVARGVSHRLAFVVLSVVQMVPRMQGRAAAILDAQQARGLPLSGSLFRRLRALVPLVGPVVLGSLIDVRERTFALEARGFGTRPGRTSYRLVVDPRIDRWLRLAILMAALGVVAAAVLGLGR